MLACRRLLISLLIALVTSNALADRQPNVIFIMADDLGYAGLGCYGNEALDTPNLDRLASGGVKCTDFHSNAAVCSPTRAAMMTGRYQQRSGVSGVITALSHRDKGLPLDQWTLAEAMKEQGYATAMFGKWHLGYDPKFNPTQQGFNEYRGFVSGNIDYHRHIDQEGHFDWWMQSKLEDDPGYLTDLISDYSVDFIRRHKDAPFMLMLTHGAPHTPIQNRETPGFRVTGKLAKRQPRQKLKDAESVYHDMIHLMDEGVGKIVAAVEGQGLRENTLIIFCSDNGPSLRLGSAGPYRAGKGSVYEGGHRVPGIFNWPGTLPAGAVCDTPILTMDMLPTFVELTGGASSPPRPLDGVSVLQALQGKPLERGPLFWQHKAGQAVRHGDWKLVVKGDSSQLFNLDQDRSEKHDLAEKHPEKVAELSDLLTAWDEDVHSEGIVVSNF